MTPYIRDVLPAYDGGQEGAVRHGGTRVKQVERFWSWAYDSDRYGEFIPRPRRLEMREETPRTTVAPTFAEMDACIRCAHLDWHQRLLVIMRYTGLRVSQAREMLWTDFDPKGLFLSIRPELGKTARERAGRRIPYSRHLRAEMLTWSGSRTGTVVPARHWREAIRHTRSAWEKSEVRREVWDGPDGRTGQPHHAFRKGVETGLMKRDTFIM